MTDRRRPSLRVLARALTVLVPLAGIAGPSHAADNCVIPQNIAEFRANLVAAINAKRAEKGVAPLKIDDRLQAAAQLQSCDNAVKGIYSHTGLDGSDLATRLKREGYPTAGALENTGMGADDAPRIVAFWMTSPFHRGNMLSAKVSQAGIGRATGTDGNDFWVVDFGSGK